MTTLITAAKETKAGWELTLTAYGSLGYEEHCSWLTKKVQIFFPG